MHINDILYKLFKRQVWIHAHNDNGRIGYISNTFGWRHIRWAYRDYKRVRFFVD